MRRLKIKVVGDEKVGKTRFLAGWYNENCSSYDDTPLFPGQKRNLPAVQDPYFTNMTVDRVSYVLTYWDTICGADFLKFRPLEYEETDVFLVFFDITNPCSFQNVSTVWVPELKHYMPAAPILIVGNKTDLRNTSNAADDMISFSKGCELAARLGTLYCESSALTGEGVRQVIDSAVRLAIRKPNTPKPKFKVFQWQRKHSKILRHGPNPPILSPPDPVPQVEVLPSTFTDDMKKMFRVGGNTDIKFLFNSNNSPIEAHQVVLSIGSTFFQEYFLNKSENLELSRLLSSSDPCSCLLKDSRQKNCPQGLDFSGSSSPQDLDSGSSAKTHTLKRPRSKFKMCIHFNNSVSGKAFQHVLEYLYSGLPNISPEADESLLSKVISLSHRLQLLRLGQICENISNGESYLNPSIASLVEEERRKAVKETFINKPRLSDVTFCVNNSTVYAHRAILMARSEVMAAMLGGGFSEGDSHEVSIKGATVNSFLSLLDYLYTDCLSSDLTTTEYKDLLVLADRFCLARLITVCEVAIRKKIGKELKTKRLNSAKCAEVIDLLLLAQVHNAPQLAQWCLHLITTNFLEFESCEDFELIKGDNRRHVLEHRWPPLAYLKELEDFKRKTGRARIEVTK